MINDRMPTFEKLPYGSGDAIYAGCVRGVIRWQLETTGHYPELAAVQLFCEDARRTFDREQRRRYFQPA